MVLRHRVRKVRNNRVRKEKGFIKHKACGHIKQEARETQELIRLETRASRGT